MTGAPIILSPGGHADLRDVMTVMDDSFDPRFGEAWTKAQCAGLLPLAGVWLTLARENEKADEQVEQRGDAQVVLNFKVIVLRLGYQRHFERLAPPANLVFHLGPRAGLRVAKTNSVIWSISIIATSSPLMPTMTVWPPGDCHSVSG